MQRRRLSSLGRMAAQVAYWAQGESRSMPVVLGSRYGDAARSLALLGDLIRDEPLSPTVFGLSVHNAIGAMYSIARGDRSNYLSVSAGATSAAACLVEAAGLLADGEPEALVVCYDAPLPGAYADFEDEPAASYAWAWRVSAPALGQPHFRLEAGASEPEPVRSLPLLPFGLDVLRFYLAGDSRLQRAVGRSTWTWSRHG